MICFPSKKTARMPSWEQIQEIPLVELYPFKNHPFKVLNDGTVMENVYSV